MCFSKADGIIASLTHVNVSEVEEVRVLNPVVPGESIDDKEISLDINVIINARKPINIEMQTYRRRGWTRLFKAQSWEDLKMLAEENKTIEQAIISAWQMTEDERIREQMRRREEGERMWNAIVKEAELSKQEAKLAKQQLEAEKLRADEAEKTIRLLQAELASFKNKR